MKIKFFCPHWGSEHLAWPAFFAKVQAAGYDGVEMSLPLSEWEKTIILTGLQAHGLELIAQHWQTVDPDLETHLATYAQHLRNLAAAQPLFINSQSGKDFFTFAQNQAVLEKADEIARETGVTILHETHRGKFSFCTTQTKQYLDAFPALRLTADFSHWCNVAETFLQDQPAIVAAAIERADHIHARVGFPECPQVNDPRAPEWQEALAHHLGWWDAIVAAHQRKGSAVLTVTPEFGPYPYMPALPFTRQPVTSQWEVNCYMKDLLKSRWQER